MAIREDAIGFGGLVLLQDTDSFCYGVDAVLLADYCRAGPQDALLDLGSGNGAVAMIAAGKYNPARITGIELQEAAAALAQRSAERNGLQDRMRFLQGDVKDTRSLVPAGAFSVVTCNPPYGEAGRGAAPESEAMRIARYETSATLSDFINAASYALKEGGRFVLVHRPARLADIFESCRAAGLEPKRMRLVIPRPGGAPNIALVSAVKGGGMELHVDPVLCIRNDDGSYTDELQEIYGRR